MAGPRNKQQTGFTLIELLVSISIFAVLSVMAYGSLDYVVNTDAVASKQMNRLSALQKTMLLVQADIEQMRPRPIRDAYGTQQPAMATIINEPYRNTDWTRGGRQTWLNTQSSGLMRVGYGVKENQLLRYQWPVLDQAPDSVPLESALLKDVKNLSFRFLDENKAWHNQWPPEDFSSSTPPDPAKLPLAVEVTLELEDWGKVTRLFHGLF